MKEIDTADILAYATLQRGRIIDVMSVLELQMNLFLSSYFIPIKDNVESRELHDFYELILDSSIMPYSKKKNLCITIISRHFEAAMATAGGAKYSNSATLSSALHDLGEIRNVFAHRSVSCFEGMSFESFKEDQTITFIRFKGDPERVTFKKEKVEASISTAREIINVFYLLIQNIK